MCTVPIEVYTKSPTTNILPHFLLHYPANECLHLDGALVIFRDKNFEGDDIA